MTRREGYVRTKFDIKLLILYFLTALPEPAGFDNLSELATVDGAIDFFDFCQCVSELEATEHLVRNEDGLFSVTAKGVRNCKACQTNLAWSVRTKAEALAESISQKLQRGNYVIGRHSSRPSGDFTVHLELKDVTDTILSVDIMAASEEQAGVLERNFKANAEKIYNSVLNALTEDYSRRKEEDNED